MARIRAETYIDVPRERLWAIVSDFDQMTDWVSFADELTYLSEGEIGVGTIYREVSGVGPIRSESEWEITVFEPPKRQVHVGDLGIMDIVLTMTLEDQAGWTRFTQTVEIEAFPGFRPVGWMLETLFIKRVMRSGLVESQAKLKQMAEAT